MKTFWEGKWHLVLDNGMVAGVCIPPTDAEKEQWQATGKKYEVKSTRLYSGDKCPYCGARQKDALCVRCYKCKGAFGLVAEVPGVTPPIQAQEETRQRPPRPPPGMMEYKVLTQRDHWFKGNFTVDVLEDAMNHYSSEGWKVVAVTTTTVGKGGLAIAQALGAGLGPEANRQEVLVFMERRVSEQPPTQQ